MVVLIGEEKRVDSGGFDKEHNNKVKSIIEATKHPGNNIIFK